MGDSLHACSAWSEFNPQKPVFDCKQLSGRLLLPRYQKSPYMTPARLRRRYALDQRIARLTRKKGHRPFTKCCSALSEINPQNTAFGRKQLSGHILLPRYQKTGVRAAGFWWIILLRMYPSCLRWFLMDCNIGGDIPKPILSPLCIFWSS